MAQLVVRDLDDEVKRRLRLRAKRHGRSMEAEIRDILSAAVAATRAAPSGLGSRIANRFTGSGLDEPVEELRDWAARVPELTE
jgi:plasmid stability protein